MYSNTTARPHPADVARVKRQMAEHLVRPVEFVAQIEDMYKDGARVFVEVGPKSVLTRLTARILENQPHVAVAIDDGSGMAGLLAGIAQLLCAGIELDVAQLFARRDCRIGDPADPAALLRLQPIAKHAWMLNGSGARRLAEPVRQVGVTLEQAQASAAKAAALLIPAAPVFAPLPERAAPTPALNTVVSAPVTQVSSVTTQHAWRKGRTMDERRPIAGMADSSVMSDYFLTMRQFLETQERVMSSFLGDGASAGAMRPQAMRSRPIPMALPRVAEVSPAPVAVQVVVPVAAPPVPVAAPVAAAPVVAPKAVAPAPVQAPKVVAPAPKAAEAVVAAVKPSGDALTRDKLVDMLLGIVEEKTGYPRDMVGLDQNLEADLGIDSIKRIEVVGAMLQMLPAGYREALTESRSKLNTQPTLSGMLDLIAQAKVGGAVAVPFDLAGVGVQADVVVSHLPRLVMRPQRESVAENALRRLTPGRFVLTRDRLGVADGLAAALGARGVPVEFIELDVLANEAALIERCAVLAATPLAGIVHLATLGSPALTGLETPSLWRESIQVNEKSLFLMMRELSACLVDDAHVVAATDLGGLFAREGSAAQGLRLQSGGVGGVKSLLAERPTLRVKAVDLDPQRAASDLALDLLAEIELDGGRQEVGYPQGLRTVFHTLAEDVVTDVTRDQALAKLVVLATGGARGITAEVLRELALPGNVLVLTGRSTVPEQEADELAGLADADALRKHFFGQVRSGAVKMTPGDINRRVQNLIGLREVRSNLADFRASGAVAEYHAVDVTDEDAVRALLDDVKRRHGRIDGVVHGAGVIEDKLIVDKQSDSWSRVVDTKVIGLLLLQKLVDASTLKFFTVFSSVAGRYGNSGQSDYATANELMNRLCMSLQARWGAQVAVSALCWGPWGATKFGAGMVTAETEAKFAEKGVGLVSASLGRRLFRQELSRVAGTPVEVVCGAAPWESREVELGVVREAPPPADAPDLGPLLGRGVAVARPTGERIVPVRLDPARHLYLHEHALDGKLVLPAAAALEMMAEAARSLWPGWCVVEVREHKLLKGVDLTDKPRDLQVFVSPPPYGSSEGFEVNAALQSDLGNGRAMNHYRCIVRLEQALPMAEPAARNFHDDKSLTVAKAYGEWLFHGPRFQVIEAIDGLSPAGSGARVRSSRPSEWLGGESADATGWLFDPALLDAAAQMAWLWSRAYRDESALPTRFGRVVRYRDHFPSHMHMEYERIATTDPTLIRGNVIFFDEQGVPVMLVEELDSVASAALNRLGGTARTAAAASV